MSSQPDTLDLTVAVLSTKDVGWYQRRWSTGDSSDDDPRPIPLGFANLGSDGARMLEPGSNLLREQLRELEKAVGSLLFEALFEGGGRGIYKRAYRDAQLNKQRLRIWLRLPPELENLPFELLYDAEHGLFLAANAFTSLVRGTVGQLVSAPQVSFPLRLLIVAAEPEDAPRVNATAETQTLLRALQDLEELRVWKTHIVQGPDTLGQLEKLPNEFHVLHFIGHGSFHQGKSMLIFEDSRRRCDAVDTDALVAVLAGYADLRLIVLNSCYGGRALAQQPFASIAHCLLALQFPAVVAMQRAISQASAIHFAHEFYGRIADFWPFDRAIGASRLSLHRSRSSVMVKDWFNPQLYLRSSTGQLFAATSDRLPWEVLLDELLTQKRLREALEILKKAGAWDRFSPATQSRLIVSVRGFADVAVTHQQWSELAGLAEYCTSDDLSVQKELEHWKRTAANRIHWRDSILQPLAEQLRSGDRLRASRAHVRCQRIIKALGEGPSSVCPSLYPDAAMFQQFRAEDIQRLVELQVGHEGRLLSEPIVQVIDVLDAILQLGRLPLKSAGCPIPGGLRHAIDDPKRLARARQRLVEDRTLHALSLSQLIDRVKGEMSNDGPLVLWALGCRQQAISDWESQLRTCGDMQQRYAVHWHLALAGFPPAVEFLHRLPLDGAGLFDTAQALDERALISWAALVAEGKGVAAFWSRRRRVPSSGDGSSPDDLCVEVAQWLQRQLPRLREADQPAEGTTLAAGDALVGSEAPLGGSSSFDMTRWWFAAEVAGASLMNRLLESSGRAIEGCGYAGVARFGYQQTLKELCCEQQRAVLLPRAQPAPSAFDPQDLLAALNDASGASCSQTAERVLFALRVLFSQLRLCHVSLEADEIEWAQWQMAATVIHVPAAAETSCFDFLGNLPEDWRPSIVPVHLSQLVQSNPAHAVLDMAEQFLAADLCHVCARIVLGSLNRALSTAAPNFARATDLANMAHLLAAGTDPELQGQVHTVHALGAQAVADMCDTEDGAVLAKAIGLLQALARIERSPLVDEHLAQALLSLAMVLLAEGEVSAAIPRLFDALHADPTSKDSRVLLCLAMLGKARHYYRDLGDVELAQQHLTQLRKLVDEAPQQSADLSEIVAEAKELEIEWDNPPSSRPPPELPKPNWQALIDEVSRLMREGRVREAIDKLVDAVLIAEDDGPEQSHAFTALFDCLDSLHDIDAAWAILKDLARFFPNDPRIQHRLDVLQEINDRLHPPGTDPPGTVDEQ